jgi:hypothetical protein
VSGAIWSAAAERSGDAVFGLKVEFWPQMNTDETQMVPSAGRFVPQLRLPSTATYLCFICAHLWLKYRVWLPNAS